MLVVHFLGWFYAFVSFVLHGFIFSFSVFTLLYCRFSIFFKLTSCNKDELAKILALVLAISIFRESLSFDSCHQYSHYSVRNLAYEQSLGPGPEYPKIFTISRVLTISPFFVMIFFFNLNWCSFPSWNEHTS